MVLHCLDDDDRVIDHQPDGQHQAKKRKRVDGEAERRKDDECSYQRNRNSQQGNERGAPPLQKNEDNDHNKAKRFKERQQDLVDTGGNCLRGIERNAVSDARRKSRRKLFHALPDGLCGLNCVGAGQLVNGHDARRGLVVAG